MRRVVRIFYVLFFSTVLILACTCIALLYTDRLEFKLQLRLFGEQETESPIYEYQNAENSSTPPTTMDSASTTESPRVTATSPSQVDKTLDVITSSSALEETTVGDKVNDTEMISDTIIKTSTSSKNQQTESPTSTSRAMMRKSTNDKITNKTVETSKEELKELLISLLSNFTNPNYLHLGKI